MKIIYLLAFVGFATGCATMRPTGGSPDITGHWEWVSTTGGFAGRTSTPATSHKTQGMQITPDSLFYYQSGELERAAAYRLIQAESNLSHTDGWMIEGSDRKVFVERKDSTLILKEDCWDCFTHTYHRIPKR